MNRSIINHETKQLFAACVGHAIKSLEKWVATLYLDDLNLSYNQQGALSDGVSTLRRGLQDNEYHYISQSDYGEFYEELESQMDEMDSMVEDVELVFTEMVDNGWADEGYRERVQAQVENEILPLVESAIDDLTQYTIRINKLTTG
jgi:hypothetical protein